jgi:hypothetical protein
VTAAPEAARAYLARGWQPVRIPAGLKGPTAPKWQLQKWQPDDFGADDNIGVLLGPRSGDLVDIDLDCPEALALADIYLPPTGAVFGRASKPRSHRLYIAPEARKETFADPTNGEMIVELRAAGRDVAGHQTLFPPSIADGERREWYGDRIEPTAIAAPALRTSVAWLAIGCLVMKHVSEHAARRPGADLPQLLYEAEPVLGRRACQWIGLPDPDAPKYQPKPRCDLSATDVTLWELAAVIPNDNADWDAWNSFGLAFFAASNGSNEGFLAFDRYSAQSAKYVGAETAARWRHFAKCPPSNTGIGKLIAAAVKAGWRSERRHGTG